MKLRIHIVSNLGDVIEEKLSMGQYLSEMIHPINDGFIKLFSL